MLDGFNVVQHKIHPVGVKIHADSDDDDAETIVVEIVKADVVVKGRRIPITVTDSKATGTITDVDPDTVTLPEISVADATAEEGTDESVDFVISLDLVPTEIVRVDYSIRSGTATARQDFGVPVNGFDGTLCFLPSKYTPGETCRVGTSQTISVPIMDDAVDEGSETLTLRLRNPSNATISDAEAIGTITNDDPLQTMWLSRFGRTVGGQVVDAVAGRLSGPAPGSQVTLGGESIDLTRVSEEAELAHVAAGLARILGVEEVPAPRPGDDGQAPGAAHAAPQGMTGRELLLGSAFHLTRERDGSGPGLAAWGRVTIGGFDGEAPAEKGTVRIDGDVTTGILGADAEWNRLLAGVAISVSEGEGTFAQPGVDSGTIESTMTTVSPYARLSLNDRASAWGLAGWGTGDMTIVQTARAANGDKPKRDEILTRTDLSMRLAAVGGRHALLQADEAGGIDLTVKADAFYVETESEAVSNEGSTTGVASRVRLALETGRAFDMGNGATLRPSLELGLRHDGGDAETGTGVEIGAGVSYADPASGLSVEAKTRMLVAHADSDYREWGASAAVRLAPDERGRGLSLSLSPTLGAADSGADRLWGARDAGGLAPDGEFAASRGLNAELGYGLSGPQGFGILTPYTGLSLTGGAERTLKAGARWNASERATVALEATREEEGSESGNAGHTLMLRAQLRF